MMQSLKKTPTVLAPMAGFTDAAFRSICMSFGCGMTVTEMVSSMALVHGNKQTRELLNRELNDTNCAVQIFGHDPVVMAESAEILREYNFSAIDINMGCPMKKIVNNGDGSALLENPVLAGKIVRAVKDAAKNLVTVKFRTGVSDSKNAENFAKILEDSGADAITVHLRTRNQMYGGQADYTILPQIVKSVKIPVIANGDIDNFALMQAVLNLGAAGVAVGRHALGNPFVFKQLTKDGCGLNFDVCATLKRHIELISKYKPEKVAVNEMKKHIAYYLKHHRGAKAVIVEVMGENTLNGQFAVVERFLKEAIKC